MKIRSLILFLCISFNGLYAQDNILDNPELLHKVNSCLHDIYSYDFVTAKKEQAELEKEIPDHPVCSFLEGLIIYWENMPLLPENPETDLFLDAMKKSASQSELLLKKDPDHLEAIFFDLHARAFMTMFWADNGKPARVLKDIDNLYKRTMQGIDKKEKFNEFYFSSGLYSYYVEAYLELHPIYKPIAILFRKGDKERGLMELQYAIDSTTYIRVESLLFMSLLQLNYEKDIMKALDYAAVLYNNYPENTYYTGHYLMILLYQDEFELARVLLERLEKKEDSFPGMLHMILSGFVIENDFHMLRKAERNYQKGIKMAENFGPFADIYQAIAYAGLSRISKKQGDSKLSRKYKRKSESLSKYEFIRDYE